MLVVLRFEVAAGGEARFLADARTALAILAALPGWRSGRLGPRRRRRDPLGRRHGVGQRGAYRRALSSYEVKMRRSHC